MEESILKTVKKLLGLLEDDPSFDLDVITHINSTLVTLQQLGFPVPVNFSVDDEAATWTELLPTDKDVRFVKTYIALKVRLVFDPPANSFTTNSMQEQVRELESRILYLVDDQSPTIFEEAP